MGMDKKQEDLQFLGVFGIFKESFKLIFKWNKIFSKITLALILPYSFITLAYLAISNSLSSKSFNNITTLDNKTQVDLSTYNHASSSNSSRSWAPYLLLNLVYLIFSANFSLLSLSAVAYTISCIYTAKEITFKKVMSVLPKVWKKVMITFLCTFLIILAYTFVFFLVLGIILVGIFIMSNGKSVEGKVGLPTLVIIGIILYSLGIVFMSICWQLANVISVLEDHCGIQAMKKSKKLIKGKIGTSIGISIVLIICSLPYNLVYMHIRVNSVNKVGFGDKIAYGVLGLVWLTFIGLLGFVVQTVLYFVCKAYHHENVDNSSMSNYLEAYVVEYRPLNPKDVKFNQLDV